MVEQKEDGRGSQSTLGNPTEQVSAQEQPKSLQFLFFMSCWAKETWQLNITLYVSFKALLLQWIWIPAHTVNPKKNSKWS